MITKNPQADRHGNGNKANYPKPWPIQKFGRHQPELILNRWVDKEKRFVYLEPLMGSSSSKLQIGELIWQAGPVVKLVLLLLLVMSVISIAIIIGKVWFQMRRSSQINRKFLQFFWEADALEAVYAVRDRFRNCPLARVFNYTYKEYREILSKTKEGGNVNTLERLLRTAIQNEVATIEHLLPFLAITASSAPFIGLFGTVWGIMDAFLGIGAKGSTSLAVVAPGIAEALIATAMGLFAAIPAAIFYNLLLNRVKTARREFEGFGTDLLGLMIRSGPVADQEHSMSRARAERL